MGIVNKGDNNNNLSGEGNVVITNGSGRQASRKGNTNNFYFITFIVAAALASGIALVSSIGLIQNQDADPSVTPESSGEAAESTNGG